MRQKLRLTFDQLEKEMELEGSILSSPMELSAITGGSNIDKILQYYQSLGFIFTKGSDGNYDGSKNITLENVTVTGTYNNKWYEIDPYWYKSLLSIAVTTTNDTAYDDHQYMMDQYNNMVASVLSRAALFQNLTSGGANATTTYDIDDNNDPYCNITPYNPYTNTQDPGPWLRDENGNIIADVTNTAFVYDRYGINIYMREVILHTSKGNVKLYEALNAYDSSGNSISLDDMYQSNCFGYAIAEGKYWFNDNPATSENEINNFDLILDWFYEECSSGEASIAVITNGGSAYHAGQYNSATGQFSAKGGIGNIYTYNTVESFRFGGDPSEFGDFPQISTDNPGLYNIGDIKYYKKKNNL